MDPEFSSFSFQLPNKFGNKLFVEYTYRQVYVDPNMYYCAHKCPTPHYLPT